MNSITNVATFNLCSKNENNNPIEFYLDDTYFHENPALKTDYDILNKGAIDFMTNKQNTIGSIITDTVMNKISGYTCFQKLVLPKGQHERPKDYEIEHTETREIKSLSVRYEIWKTKTIIEWIQEDGSGSGKDSFNHPIFGISTNGLNELTWSFLLSKADINRELPFLPSSDKELPNIYSIYENLKFDEKNKSKDIFKLFIWDFILRHIVETYASPDLKQFLSKLKPASLEDRVDNVVQKINDIGNLQIIILNEVQPEQITMLKNALQTYHVISALDEPTGISTLIIVKKDLVFSVKSSNVTTTTDNTTEIKMKNKVVNGDKIGQIIMYYSNTTCDQRNFIFSFTHNNTKKQVYVCGIHLDTDGKNLKKISDFVQSYLKPKTRVSIIIAGDFNFDLRNHKDTGIITTLAKDYLSGDKECISTCKKRTLFHAQPFKSEIPVQELKDFILYNKFNITQPIEMHGYFTKKSGTFLPNETNPSDHAFIYTSTKQNNINAPIKASVNTKVNVYDNKTLDTNDKISDNASDTQNNEIYYYNKYLKYKNKYITMKNEL